MWTILLVDSDMERGRVVAEGITGDWKVKVVSTTAEIMAELRTDDSIARIICSYRYGLNESATTLHAQLADWLEETQVDMTVLVWEEDSLDSLEQVYLRAHGVDLVLTWKDVEYALVPGSKDHGLVS